MKKILFSLFLLSSNTYAQFFAGLEGNVQYWKTVTTKDVNGAHEGMGLSGGFRFLDYWSVEGFWKRSSFRNSHYYLDGADLSSLVSDHYVDNMFGVGGRGTWKWLSGTVGVVSHHFKKETTYIEKPGVMTSSTFSAINIYYGGGFVVPHYEFVQPYGEVIYFPSKEVDILDFSIGGRYFF
ncbi:MAG: hypothetical protein ACOYL6_18670 [Bacteriovoracaceae bacterium]